MKTLTTSILLSVVFLSAGALAGARHDVPVPAKAAAARPGNITVITKNDPAWPPAGQIFLDPCSHTRCIAL